MLFCLCMGLKALLWSIIHNKHYNRRISTLSTYHMKTWNVWKEDTCHLCLLDAPTERQRPKILSFTSESRNHLLHLSAAIHVFVLPMIHERETEYEKIAKGRKELTVFQCFEFLMIAHVLHENWKHEIAIWYFCSKRRLVNHGKL